MTDHAALLEGLLDRKGDCYDLTLGEHNAIRAAIALMRAPVGDRAALEYLMVQFDAEFHACERCGHEEPTKDCDSAIYLRRYLGETK